MTCQPAPGVPARFTLLLCAALAAATACPAATLTWTGQFAASQSPPGSQGSDSFMARSTGGLSNWAGSLLPATGDDLVFGQAGFTRPVNTSARTVGSLVFDTDASAYTISGGPLRVNTGITNRSSVRQVLDLDLAAGGSQPQHWDGGQAGLSLRLSGVLDAPVLLTHVQGRTGNLALVRGLSMTDSQMQMAGPVQAGGASFEMRLINSQWSTVDAAEDTAVIVYAPDTLIDLANSQARFTTLAAGGQRTEVRVRSGSLLSARELRLGASGVSGWRADLTIAADSGVHAERLLLRTSGRVLLQGGTLQLRDLIGTHPGWLAWDSGRVRITQDLLSTTLGAGLRLAAGQTLEVDGQLSIAAGDALTLDGGELRVARLADQGARLNWRRGNLSFTQALALGDSLPRAVALGAGMQLTTGTLDIGNGSLVLAGGMLQASRLTLAGGSFSGVTQLGDTALAGHGQVMGRIDGSGPVLAAGGMLVLGDGAVASAVRHRGRLDVQDQALLLAADTASWADVALLGPAARLYTLHGLRVDSTLQGSGWLQGDVHVAGRLQPGAAEGQGLGRLDFGSAGLTLGDTAITELDLGLAGSDWLGGAHVSLAGVLQLRVAPGVALHPGMSWQTMSFDRVEGQFSRIDVLGADAAQLDLSALASNGRITVSAVPEPANALLMLLGGALLAARRRS